MFKNVPVSYKDPFWSDLAEQAATEFNVPPDLLKGILLKGEKSNADQVSSAGARTPFQIIPKTREGIIKNYGFDPYARPIDSARGAAALLRESLDRNKGDKFKAVQEYHGGLDPKGYGPVNRAYVQRVLGTQEPKMKDNEVSELVRMFQERKQRTAPTTAASEAPQESGGEVSDLLAIFRAKRAAQQPIDVPTPANLAATSAPVAPKPEEGFLDTAAGVGETALSLLTGATGGVLGMAAGGVGGLAQSLAQGTFGTQQGVKDVQASAMRGMQGLTYAPRTEAGQRMTGAVGDFAASTLPPVMPIIGPAGALSQSAATAVNRTANRFGMTPKLTPEQQGFRRVNDGSVFDENAPIPSLDEINIMTDNGGMGFPDGVPPQPARSTTQAARETQAATQVGDLVRKASGSGLGTTKAQEELAALAKVNPEAKAAADRLGIELPADVFSDNPQVVAAAGLTRSAAGSEAEAAWRNTVRTAADKADEVMNQLDASTDVSQVSENVRKSLLDTRNQLRNDATKIYNDVDAAVPKSTPVEMNALRQQLDQVVEEVGVSGLNSVEKRLKAMLDSGEPITYARLIREKNVLGDKVGGKSPLEADLDTASAKRLYGALAQDQLDSVGRIGGDELRTQLRGANALYAKERALAKRIVNAYGSETDGSIAALMSRSVKNAQKGDSRDLAKLLKVVPKDLQKETLATAIMANTRSRSGNSLVKGGFGFSEFTDFYGGLRKNAPLYGQVSQVLGEDAMKVMRDMYEVSKRVTEARANVLTTGKANQALLNSMQAEGVLGAVLGKVGSGLGRASATGAGATVGGPFGAAAINMAIDMLARGKPDRIQAAGKLFTDDKFQKLMTEAATKPASSPGIRSQVKALVRTPAFLRYANTVNLTGGPAAYERFMLSVMTQQTEEQ